VVFSLAKPPQSLQWLPILHAIFIMDGGRDFGGADNFCGGWEVASTNTSATTEDLWEDGRQHKRAHAVNGQLRFRYTFWRKCWKQRSEDLTTSILLMQWHSPYLTCLYVFQFNLDILMTFVYAKTVRCCIVHETNIQLALTIWTIKFTGYTNQRKQARSTLHILNCGKLWTAYDQHEIQHTEWRVNKKGKGKAIPLQAWTGPEGSRRLRLPDFKTIGTWRW